MMLKSVSDDEDREMQLKSSGKVVSIVSKVNNKLSIFLTLLVIIL